MKLDFVRSCKYVMFFERTACFGTWVRIFANRKVLWSGSVWSASKKKWEKRVGHGEVSQDQFQRLIELFRAANYGDRFVSGKASCGARIYDVSTVRMKMKYRGETTSLDHNSLCPLAPKHLVQMEAEIDKIVNTEKFLSSSFKQK